VAPSTLAAASTRAACTAVFPRCFPANVASEDAPSAMECSANKVPASDASRSSTQESGKPVQKPDDVVIGDERVSKLHERGK